MKKILIHNLFHTFCLFALIFVFACAKKNETSAALLAGTSSKRWHTEKERNASGEKVKQTDEDKSTLLQLYANGNFSMNSNTNTMSGTYTYDEATKTLTLTPTGSATSKSFQVTKLEDDELDLKAPDGSTMDMETEH